MVTPRTEEDCKWSKPSSGFIKINVDGAMEKCKGSGIGVLARDENGMLIFVAAKKVQDAKDSEVVEAESVSWGLELSLERGFYKIWIDSDSHTLICKLQNGCDSRGEISFLIKKIKVLARRFTECRWSFVRRSANEVADFLAKTRPDVPFISSSLFSLPLNFKTLLNDNLN